MKRDYSVEIAKFKSSAKRASYTPAQWMKLREACEEKFGEDEGKEKFKAWQRGKVISYDK